MRVPRVTFQIRENERRLQRYMIGVGQELMKAAGASQHWPLVVPVPYRWAGGTRMGLGPENSVVDDQCRVHGTNNLFVVGSSVFPTMTSYPATETIGALAYRLADHLIQAEELFH